LFQSRKNDNAGELKKQQQEQQEQQQQQNNNYYLVWTPLWVSLSLPKSKALSCFNVHCNHIRARNRAAARKDRELEASQYIKGRFPRTAVGLAGTYKRMHSLQKRRINRRLA
jgi:hypothetical protein